MRHRTITGPKYEWYLCGDIFVNNRCLAFRQIPVKEIIQITELPNKPDNYTLHLSEFETFEESQSSSDVKASHKETHLAKTQTIKQQTQLSFCIRDLDKYFAKRNDLREKHINAFHKLKTTMR